MSAVAKPEDPSPILACTVSRDVQDFELLIDEMEAEFGEAWGDLLLHEALAFLDDLQNQVDVGGVRIAQRQGQDF